MKMAGIASLAFGWSLTPSLLHAADDGAADVSYIEGQAAGGQVGSQVSRVIGADDHAQDSRSVEGPAHGDAGARR